MDVATACIAALGGLLLLNAWSTWQPTAAVDQSWQPGLVYAGAPLENIYAYDCEGRPLDAVQLFDRWGAPIAADPAYVPESYLRVTPNDAVGDEPLWNVYPLDQFGDDGSEPLSRVPALDDCPVSPDEQGQP